MAKSLLEQLPDIVTKGRQQAEKSSKVWCRHRVGLQTREWVLPAGAIAPRPTDCHQRTAERLTSVQPGLFGEVQPSWKTPPGPIA
ncbi:MAG: hypothetical protein IPP03_22905 [Dechloromonas sp.]|nr:hypothetical protein [Candidatus Dechloromonas phosphoritropha]